MNKKIIVTLIVLLFCASCLCIVSADNSTNETLEINESETADMSSYIMPISITDNGIEFSDGFTGFCLDLTKDSITADDGFVSEGTSGNEIQNYVKLAIIEAYRQGREDELGQIIISFADGSYKSSTDKVITAVLESQETIGDESVAELEDSIEGTFEFELLKDANGNKSDCLAYTVSLKEMPNDDKLATASEDNATDEALANSSDDDKVDNATDNDKTDESNDTSDKNKTDENTTGSADNETDSSDDEKTKDASDNNKTDEKATESTDNKTKNETQPNETIVTETNKTIVNKTNTVIINENNTTTINKNNNKIINKTTNETPDNATIQEKLLKTVGNPIFLLILVIAIAAIVAVVMRRKG